MVNTSLEVFDGECLESRRDLLCRTEPRVRLNVCLVVVEDFGNIAIPGLTTGSFFFTIEAGNVTLLFRQGSLAW